VRSFWYSPRTKHCFLDCCKKESTSEVVYRRSLETQTRIIVSSSFVLFDFGVVSVQILEHQKQFAEERKLSFSVLTGPQNGPPGTTKSASHAGALIYDQKLCFCEGRLASHAFFGCITKNTISSHAKSGRFAGSVFKNAVSSHASRTTGYYNIGRVNDETCAMRPPGGDPPGTKNQRRIKKRNTLEDHCIGVRGAPSSQL
jgi:hypothetical protein